MSHESRRTLRSVISTVHIIGQAVLMWLILDAGFDDVNYSGEVEFGEPNQILAYLGLMQGLFFIHFTVQKMLSNRHHSHSE